MYESFLTSGGWCPSVMLWPEMLKFGNGTYMWLSVASRNMDSMFVWKFRRAFCRLCWNFHWRLLVFLYFFPINKLILIHWEEGKKWWPTFYLGWVLVDQRVARTSHKPWVIGKCWIFCCWCWHFKYPICVHNLNVEEKQQTTLWLQQCTLVVHKLCTSCHNFISIVFFWGGEIHSANFHSQFKVILD